MPADVHEPAFVINGAGAPKGLSVLEHVEWAQSLQHPDAVSLSTRVDADQQEAIDYELTATPSAIDFRRSELVASLTLQAHALRMEAQTWRQDNGIDHLNMCDYLNGPFVHYLLGWSGYSNEDSSLGDDIAGFPMVGPFPPSGPDTQPLKKAKKTSITIQDLCGVAAQSNGEIVTSIRRSQFDDDLIKIAIDDAVAGFNSEPMPLSSWHMSEVNLARRIPVREERADGWRTRPVDDESENYVNAAAHPCDTTVYDDILTLVIPVLIFLQASMKPRFWKRDVKKAFRWMLVKRSHSRFAWSVFPWR